MYAIPKIVFLITSVLLHVYVATAIPTTTTLIRTPSHDSAIIQSDRIGGNFAYSTLEGHAYAAVSPIIRNGQMPIAVSYSVAEPIITHMPMQIPIYASQYGSSYVPSTSVVIHH